MVRVQDDGDWVVIGDAADRPGVAFAQVPDYRPPTWPDRRAAAVPALRRPGGRPGRGRARRYSISGRPGCPVAGDTFRVFADPVGHPFCLILLTAPPVDAVRLVVQRVRSAAVVGRGRDRRRDRPTRACWCLVGVTHADDPATAARLADKVWNLRILAGERSSRSGERAGPGGQPVHSVRRHPQGSSTVLERRRAPRPERAAGRGRSSPSLRAARRRGGDRRLRRRHAGQPGQRRTGDPDPRLR